MTVTAVLWQLSISHQAFASSSFSPSFFTHFLSFFFIENDLNSVFSLNCSYILAVPKMISILIYFDPINPIQDAHQYHIGLLRHLCSRAFSLVDSVNFSDYFDTDSHETSYPYQHTYS